MAGTVEVGTLLSSGARSIDVDDIGMRSYAGGGGAYTLRNKIVDGRFDFWHLSDTQNASTSGYGSDDMWFNFFTGTPTGTPTRTHSRISLAAGEIPDVPTAVNCSRTIVTNPGGADACVGKSQHIESVTTLSGKKATLSFYAKADAPRNIVAEVEQCFGTNGSATIKGIGSTTFNLTTAWKRYFVTIDIPSIAGKTLSTLGNHYLGCVFFFSAGSIWSTIANNLGPQTGTFDIACIQLEEGSVATPFEELPVSVSEQQLGRYYQYYLLGIDTPIGFNPLNRAVSQVLMRNVPMRTIPTMTFTTQDGAIVKSIGGTIKATSTSMNAYHNSRFYYDIDCNFTSYTYAAGDFINIITYVISDARL